MTADDVSVIIPTYNGAGKLPGILKSLEEQAVHHFEVIVVLDGSTDNSIAFLEKYRSANLRLRIIQQENSGRAKVRNAGAMAADRDLLIFYDDDMLPEPDSIARHLQFHIKYKGAICGGNQLEDLRKAKTDFDRYRCLIRNNWISGYNELLQLASDKLHLTAANFSLRKEVFESLQGFDDSLTDHEDLDLACRGDAKGYPIYFDPNNIGWHDDFVSPVQYVKRRREYATAREDQEKKHGLRNKSSFVKKWLIYHWFSNGWFLGAIAEERLMFLPNELRYRLYSLIVWGLAEYFPKRTIE